MNPRSKPRDKSPGVSPDYTLDAKTADPHQNTAGRLYAKMADSNYKQETASFQEACHILSYLFERNLPLYFPTVLGKAGNSAFLSSVI